MCWEVSGCHSFRPDYEFLSSGFFFFGRSGRSTGSGTTTFGKSLCVSSGVEGNAVNVKTIGGPPLYSACFRTDTKHGAQNNMADPVRRSEGTPLKKKQVHFLSVPKGRTRRRFQVIRSRRTRNRIVQHKLHAEREREKGSQWQDTHGETGQDRLMM